MHKKLKKKLGKEKVKEGPFTGNLPTNKYGNLFLLVDNVSHRS